MANKKPNTKGLADFRGTRTQAKIEHVKKMVQHSLEYNELVNINLIAKKSGVSRKFIYSTPELKELIDGLREVSLIRIRKKGEQQKNTASHSSNVAKIRNLKERCKILMGEIEILKAENKVLKEYIEAGNF